MDTFTLQDVVRVARDGAPLHLSQAAEARIGASRALLERLIATGVPIYGVTTGVGDLSKTPVPTEQACTLSTNIVMSHACGVGEPLSAEQTRAIMVAAVANWSQGHSGVRSQLVSAVIDLLNHHIVPWVPSQGGMGSLTHMAHIGLTLLGLGQAWHGGRLQSSADALRAAHLSPLSLKEKEGLSIVNGTVSKTGLGALILVDAHQLACWADVAGAMSFEALKGVPTAFDPRIQQVRPHPGQAKVADNLLRLVAGSGILQKHQHHRVQDALSLRAMPQVHGACRDQLAHATRVFNVELNSATDNPLLFEPDAVLSGNNAHGEPLALALDQACMAMAELAGISERRTDRLVNHHVSELPPFLVRHSGLSSGFMIPQYVAASLVAENKVLAHPISVDSIPTTALQEDHWSMATPGALKAAQVLRNAQKVVAVELLTACQALEFHRPLTFGRGTTVVYEALRQQVPPWDEDRVFYPDLHAVIAAVERGDWLSLVEAQVGPLG